MGLSARHNGKVSIRSPRRNEGRLVFYDGYMYVGEFQSAPPAETRGDRHPLLEVSD